MRYWDSINVLTRHTFAPLPCQDLDIQRHMSWYFGGDDDWNIHNLKKKTSY